MGAIRVGLPAILLSSLALAALPTTGSDAPLSSVADGSAVPVTVSSPGYGLEVTPWRLVKVRGDEGLRSVPETFVSRLRIADGRAVGSTGCRPFTADAFRALAVVQFSTLRAIDDGNATCAPRGESLDRDVLAGLKRATAFQVVPAGVAWQASLAIRDPRGQIVLVYEVDAPTAPDDGLWQLAALQQDDGAPVSATTDASPAVLAFEPQDQDGTSGWSRGRLVGSTGCNGLEARYELRGRRVELDGLAVTDGPCPPDLAQLEDAILAVLQGPSLRLDLAPDRLTLTADDRVGASLVYESTSPLEGSTWQLSRLAEEDLSPGAIVTLRLEGGQLSGVGLCGDLEGRYVTNGVLIEVRDTARAPGRCREARVDDALLAALDSAVFIVRDEAGLGLLDHDGRALARFRRPGGP